MKAKRTFPALISAAVLAVAAGLPLAAAAHHGHDYDRHHVGKHDRQHCKHHYKHHYATPRGHAYGYYKHGRHDYGHARHRHGYYPVLSLITITGYQGSHHDHDHD